VLTSPWPESVYAFAPIWASLAEHARLFAVDLQRSSTAATTALSRSPTLSFSTSDSPTAAL
jgi:hypothetical protein